MPAKVIRTAILSLSIFLVYFWTSIPALNNLNLQLTGALVLLYFAFKLFFRHTTHRSFFPDTLILISICLLLIFSTGGLTSPLFFVLDFLLFAVALLLSPFHAGVASAQLVTILVYQNIQSLTSTGIIDLLSLVLITPLAIVFSRVYLKNLVAEGKISVLREAIKDEETDSLLWITTTAKPSLASALNSLSDIIVFINTKGQNLLLPKGLQEKLKTIQQDLISLYSSTGTLEKSITDSSDKMEL